MFCFLQMAERYTIFKMLSSYLPWEIATLVVDYDVFWEPMDDQEEDIDPYYPTEEQDGQTQVCQELEEEALLQEEALYDQEEVFAEEFEVLRDQEQHRA